MSRLKARIVNLERRREECPPLTPEHGALVLAAALRPGETIEEAEVRIMADPKTQAARALRERRA